MSLSEDAPAILVAVASSDGKTVDSHFASTPRYYVYRLTSPEDQPVLSEVRELGGDGNCDCGDTCGGGGGIVKVLEVIGDCQFVLARQIGPGAIQTILDRGLRADIFDGPIDDAFAKLRTKPRFQRLKPKALRTAAR